MKKLIIYFPIAIYSLFLVGCAVAIPISMGKGNLGSEIFESSVCARVKSFSKNKEHRKPEFYTKVLEDAGFTKNIIVFIEPRYPTTNYKDSVKKILNQNGVKTIFEFKGETTIRTYGSLGIFKTSVSTIGASVYTYNSENGTETKTSYKFGSEKGTKLSSLIAKKFSTK